MNTYQAVRAQHFAGMPQKFKRMPQTRREKAHARAMKVAAKFGAQRAIDDPKAFKAAVYKDAGILGGLIGTILSAFGPTILAALLAWLIPQIISWLTDALNKPKAPGDETVDAMLHRMAAEAGE